MSQNILTFLYMQPNQTGGYGQILQNVNVRFWQHNDPDVM